MSLKTQEIEAGRAVMDLVMNNIQSPIVINPRNEERLICMSAVVVIIKTCLLFLSIQEFAFPIQSNPVHKTPRFACMM